VLQGMAFGVRQWAHKDRGSHTLERTTFPFTYLGSALSTMLFTACFPGSLASSIRKEVSHGDVTC
jgi:hypothetical protein